MGQENVTVTWSSGEIDLSAAPKSSLQSWFTLWGRGKAQPIIPSFWLGREFSLDKDCLLLLLVASRLFALSHPLPPPVYQLLAACQSCHLVMAGCKESTHRKQDLWLDRLFCHLEFSVLLTPD